MSTPKWSSIPQQTVEIARAAFPKGNVYMTMRDYLGELYNDNEFEELFTSHYGRPHLSLGSLAMVTVMQFGEGLSDRQAAEAVRSRINWKYMLGLELTDSGFDYSVLSEFRQRLIKGEKVNELLEIMLKKFQEKKLIKNRGKIRTDSTHVCGAIRQLNRLECVGETLRQALNEIAKIAPDWLTSQISTDWYFRYGNKFEQYRLPNEKTEQQKLAITIGEDGYQLLVAARSDSSPENVRSCQSIEILEQVWAQQYYIEEGKLQWLSEKKLPQNQLLIQSPYDTQARNRTKRKTNWTGYTVHLSETCDEETPNLIVNVETTPSTVPDGDMTPKIHQNLALKDCLPSEHYVDSAYVDAQLLVDSQNHYGINLIGRIPIDSSWQAKQEQGFSLSNFSINWDDCSVTCPANKLSKTWRERKDQYNNSVIEVRFSNDDCRTCSSRSQCTRSQKNPRLIRFRHCQEHQALQKARLEQLEPNFNQKIAIRAGIEGTISQATGSFQLRHCRYIGLAKTQLQHIITAIAINLNRVVNWLNHVPQEHQRLSPLTKLKIAKTSAKQAEVVRRS